MESQIRNGRSEDQRELDGALLLPFREDKLFTGRQSLHRLVNIHQTDILDEIASQWMRQPHEYIKGTFHV